MRSAGQRPHLFKGEQHTMKKIFSLFLFLALVATLGAQTTVTSTTLAQAITSASTNQMVVTSATGFTAASNGQPVTWAYIYNGYGLRGELVAVQAVSGTRITMFLRGDRGTPAGLHASGAKVWVGPP